VFSAPLNERREVRWAEPGEAHTLCRLWVDWVELVDPNAAPA